MSLSTGLIAYYTMQNISGSTLIDEEGNYDGTINGASSVTCGLSFNSTSSNFVTLGNYIPSLELNQVTIISRFKLNTIAAGTKTIFSNQFTTWTSGNTYNSGFALNINGSNPEISYVMLNNESYSNDDGYSNTLYKAINRATSTSLSADTWYTLAATIDNNTSKLYLDGVLLCTLTTSQSMRYSGDTGLRSTTLGKLFYPANGSSFYFFDGILSKTVLYSSVLSDVEIENWVDNSDVTLSGDTAITSAAGSNNVTVSTEIACWEASSNVGWLTIDSPAGNFKGSGNISYSYTENTDWQNTRSAIITVTGGNDIEQITITQATEPFPITIDPSGSITTTNTAKSDSIAVTSNTSWTATSDQSWVTITSGASGTGNGTINYNVESLPAGVQTPNRTATITVSFDSSEQTLVINQSDGKVLYYTGNNVSGSTLIDEEGNFDATINGATPVTCGIYYDGVNDYTLVSDYVDELVLPQATIISRIKINSLPASWARFFNNLFLSAGSGRTGNSGFCLSINSSGNPTIEYVMLNNESYSNDDDYSNNSYVAYNKAESTSLSTDKWYTLAATINNNTSKLYLDGVLLCTLTTSQSIRYSSSGSFSGRLPTTAIGAGKYEGNTLIYQPFDGVISNTVLYDRVLSDAEILEWSNLSDVLLSGDTLILGDAGSDTVTVATEIACWEASSNVGWLTIDSPTIPKKGAGTINYSFTKNPDWKNTRDAIITVTGGNDIEQITITQATGPFPITIDPSKSITTTNTAKSDTITVTTSNPSNDWRATSNVSWIIIDSGSGTGNGIIRYFIGSNYSNERVGQITVTSDGYSVFLEITQQEFVQEINYTYTQYNNAPKINSLIKNFYDINSLDQYALGYYNNVFNLDTAVGNGLDFWGILLNQSRIVKSFITTDMFGFGTPNLGTGDEYPQNFDNGNFGGSGITKNITLDDENYRRILKIRYRSLTINNSIASISQTINEYTQSIDPSYFCLVKNESTGLFSYNFNYVLSNEEIGMFFLSKLLPSPAGMDYIINWGITL